MAIRFSDALNSRLAGKEGLRKLLSNSQIIFFTGSQPTSANDSKGTSQEIIAFTSGDLQLTEEVLGTAEFDLTGITTAETITSITVSGVEILGATITYDTSATATAALVAAQINSYLGAIDFKATSSAETVTIAAPNGSGIDLNDATIVAAGTGVWNAASSHFQSNGVAATTTPNTWSTGDGRFATGNGGSTAGVAAANGLTFDVQSDGAGLSPAEEVFYIGKPTGETWKGKNGFGPGDAATTAVFTGITDGNTYTAGWGRIIASSGDDGSAATSGEAGYIRLDFSVGTSGTDAIMNPAATFTVNTTLGDEIESVLSTFKLKVSRDMA